MVLALFFTRKVSLHLWVSRGLFYREKLIYEEHLDKHTLNKVYWLTYGVNDRRLGDVLKKRQELHQEVEVLPMPRAFNSRLGVMVYSLVMPFIYRSELSEANVLKTNQIDGSWSAVIARFLLKKKLLARTGYTATIFEKKRKKKKGIKSATYALLKLRMLALAERLAYAACDMATVSSESDRRYVCQRYGVHPGGIQTMHNFVDTEQFRPMTGEKHADRILYVGRLEHQKNLVSLIEAVGDLDLKLDVLGSGPLESALAGKACEMGADVRFLRTVSNRKMPSVMNLYRYFILPSHYEGMPKALLEALSCGLVCIGTDVEGIREVISDNVNGFLARGTDKESLKLAIRRAMQSDVKCITFNAAELIRRDYSLEGICSTEKQIFRMLSPC